MTLAISKQIFYSQDIWELTNLTQEMVGQKCWEARLGYLGIVRLEIGAKIPSSEVKLSRSYNGEWGFSSWEADWQLNNLNGNIISSKALKNREMEIEQKLKVLEDTVISSVELNQFNFGIRIGFDNKYSLTVTPQDLKSLDANIHWMLKLPDEQGLLQVGPKLTWSITPIGIPVYDREEGSAGLENLPQDFEVAKRLAYADPLLFESWILALLNAKPIKNQPKGIDGEIFLEDDKSSAKLRVLVEVKTGRLDNKAFEKVKAIVSQENNTLGLIVTLEEPAVLALAKQTFFDVPDLGHFPKVKILTVKDLLEKDAKLDLASLKAKEL
jgi:hypothetical protein